MNLKSYEKPELKDLGSLEDMTQQSFNKVGSSPDTFTANIPIIVGSLTPVG
jgi:hypothetical protein